MKIYLLEVREGKYYVKIENKQVAVQPEPVDIDLVVETYGEQPSFEEIFEKLKHLKRKKGESYAIHVGKSKSCVDDSYNMYWHTPLSLYKFNVNKYIPLTKR